MQRLPAHGRVEHDTEPPAPIPVQRQLDDQRVLQEAISDEFDAATLERWRGLGVRPGEQATPVAVVTASVNFSPPAVVTSTSVAPPSLRRSRIR